PRGVRRGKRDQAQHVRAGWLEGRPLPPPFLLRGRRTAGSTRGLRATRSRGSGPGRQPADGPVSLGVLDGESAQPRLTSACAFSGSRHGRIVCFLSVLTT